MKKCLFGLLMLTGCSTPQMGHLKSYTFRLKPGQDLKMELQNFAKANHIQAGAVVSCAGSLKEVALRYANESSVAKISGFHEIVSLSGTLSEDGMHIHMAVSDNKGKTWGGHLVEGNFIYTTAEITIIDQLNMKYRRELDPTYGYKELVVETR